MLVIRPMKLKDCTGVNRLRLLLHHISFGKERKSLYGLVLKVCFILSNYNILRKLIYKINPNFAFINIVATNDNNIIGLAWLQGTTNKSTMLAGLIVDKNYQKNSIGNKLNNYRNKLAKDLGIKRLELFIDGNNEGSLIAHQKYGYKIIKYHLGKYL